MKHSEQQVKKEIKHCIYTVFSGILPICSEERIEELINDTYNYIKDTRWGIDFYGHFTGCGRDAILKIMTPEEQDNVRYWFVNRYLFPHKKTYEQALQEVKNGKKKGHWMWWIFPQMVGLGKSERSQFYGLPNGNQARAFLMHPILGKHLIEITKAVYDNDKTPYEIFGNDVIKFRSCMLLFASLENTNEIFNKVLRKYCWK